MTIRIEIDGQPVSTDQDRILVDVAAEAGVYIPTLCYLKGKPCLGTCRVCSVKVNGAVVAACTVRVSDGMKVEVDEPETADIRKALVELLFTEGNHVCAVCVANSHCELQNLAVEVGMDHSRLPYRFPQRRVDLSHAQFGLDHNRCILCTRCVRVCDEVEGAHVWDVGWRGEHCQIISGLGEPWGDVSACTHCGKCVEVCPTGALFNKTDTSEEKQGHPERLQALVHARSHQQWTP